MPSRRARALTSDQPVRFSGRWNHPGHALPAIRTPVRPSDAATGTIAMTVATTDCANRRSRWTTALAGD